MAKCVATLTRETDRALLINQGEGDKWVPRSLVGWLRKEPPKPDGSIEITLQLPDWKAQELNLKEIE